MRVVVPFAASEPKTRLAGPLTAEERPAFARAMLRHVVAAIRETGHAPEVLATESVAVDAPTRVDERPLTAAVNAGLDAADEPVSVVMADLALATPAALERLFETPGDVVFAPGRGGGTNAIVARHPAFRVDYHGASIRDHREAARAVGADVAEVDSFRLSTDVDEPADLVEVLLHGDGPARDWLVDAGFEVDADGGRVGVSRQ